MRPRPRLNLTEDERESAERVIDMLLEQADELGGGALARVWRGQAEELTELLLEPAREESALVCACGADASEISVHGLPVCTVCHIGETQEILAGPGGLNELRPLIEDGYAWLLLSGRALTVMDAHQLAATGELVEIIGIGPKRRAEIEEALRQHAAGREDGDT